MIDFSENKVGDTFEAFVCDDCMYRKKLRPKSPPDSGVSSWLCDQCEHHGIGSRMLVRMDGLVKLTPLQPNAVYTTTDKPGPVA